MMGGEMDSVTGFQCRRCGNVSFPRHTRCRTCRNTEFKEASLKIGRVTTSTRLTATRPGYANELVLAVVEFEGGVKVLGQVRGGAPQTGSEVKVGEGVLGIGKDRGELRGFTFVPVSPTGIAPKKG